MSVKENKAFIDRMTKEFWNTGNMAVIGEFYSADYVGHDPSGLHAGDLAQFKQSAQAIFTGFPDLRVSIDDLVAEGDKVVKRWTAHSTHTGEFMGIPATGNPVETTGIHIYRIAGGKIAEVWANSDSLGMMQQLGVIPPMGEGE